MPANIPCARSPALSISTSRRKMADAHADLWRHIASMGAGSHQVVSLAQDVAAVRWEFLAQKPLQLEIQSEGWCGFSVCLRGKYHYTLNHSSRVQDLVPDIFARYDAGFHTVSVPRGVALVCVGLNGTWVGLADFLGFEVEELHQIISYGAISLNDSAAGTASVTEPLRRTALRLALNIGYGPTDRLALLRTRAAAMDFGLYALEALPQHRARCATELSTGRPLSMRVGCRTDELTAQLAASLAGDEAVDSIAARLGISRSTFDRAFQARMGCPPGSWRIETRLKSIARALELTDAPITALAMEFGFSSSSNLARSFKSHFGLTPTAYRTRRDS